VNWDQFIVKIIPLMITNIKDGNSKLLLKRLVEIKETDIGTIFKLSFLLIKLINYFYFCLCRNQKSPSFGFNECSIGSNFQII